MRELLPDNNNKRLAYGVIGLGLLLLVSQIFGISLIAVGWPFFVIIPGALFLMAAFSGGQKVAGLAFPGAIITGTGLLLLYQSITGHWESWAYAWALYPAMVGWALQFFGRRTQSENEISVGRNMTRFSLVGFAGLALLFELFIFGNVLTGLTGILITLALLAGGVYLLRRSDSDDAPAKLKNEDLVEKPKNRYEPTPEINPELRRKIDAALAEDDD